MVERNFLKTLADPDFLKWGLVPDDPLDPPLLSLEKVTVL